MRNAFVALFFALFMLAPARGSNAGLDYEAVSVAPDSMELIVVEADGCIYCGLFRRDVLKSYAASEQGKQLPVRFVDVNDVETQHLDFKAPVDIVPTFVVVKSLHEVGRISGYVGPENFYHSISYLLGAAP